MEEAVHREAAKLYFAVAEEQDKKFDEEKENNKKTAAMIVAAQNYFYSAVNVIEAVLCREKKEHSFSHENRSWKIKENRTVFSEEILELYEVVDRDVRNKVAYRGKNGALYKKIKKLAQLLMAAL